MHPVAAVGPLRKAKKRAGWNYSCEVETPGKCLSAPTSVRVSRSALKRSHRIGVNPATERIVAVELNGVELTVLRAHAASEHGQPLKAFSGDGRYDVVIGDERHARNW